MQQNRYSETKKTSNLPRLPLEGKIDLTYRCNNNCRHCWLRLPIAAQDEKEELSLDEIKSLVNEAKRMGCRRWFISGGEPMLRPDFTEIFDYITANSNSYSLNTNGTLITPKISRLMRRKGAKMVALYGATPQVHDHITRNPGSFEATMRGFAYLKEAGARFIVQLIPMKDNYHQLKKMFSLAKSLSRDYRIGAGWLFLSASGDAGKNKEILCQRLPAKDAAALSKSDLPYNDWMEEEGCSRRNTNDNGYLFTSCIESKRDFHIDPYGKMTFCSLMKDPALRYDLRKGNFRECWEDFIPSLADRVKATREYRDNCGSCEFRKDCRWCSSYAYLEHRKFDAKIKYLCAIAQRDRRFKENWKKFHRRYFDIAGITIQVESDLPIAKNTFRPAIKHFEVSSPGKEIITIKHHFFLPELAGRELGVKIYQKPPWAIYKKDDSWIYLGIPPARGGKYLHRVAVFNANHTRASIYNSKKETFLKGNAHSLSLFPSDQIILARALADKQGFFLHSCGVICQGEGLLFVGHSGAGKSTMSTILKGKAEILCDDRMIIRKYPEGFKIFGTWSHGDVSDVSANSAPLRAILFLEKAQDNKLIPLTDKKEITKRLLACLIKPFVTADWWDKTFTLIDKIAGQVPCYRLKFDKSGKVVDLLRQL